MADKKEVVEGEEVKVESFSPTNSGLDENLASAIAYTGILGLVFIFTEKENKVVRFHSFQGLFLSIAILIASAIVSILNTGLLDLLVNLSGLLVAIYYGYKAYKNEKVLIPVIGEIAEKQAKNKTK